jgi:hypothetical protein
MGSMIDGWLLIFLISFISAVSGLSVLLIQTGLGEQGGMARHAETDNPSIVPLFS